MSSTWSETKIHRALMLVADAAAAGLSAFALDTARRNAAREEAEGRRLIGAVLCPSGTHGDFIDGEVVPGDLPCRECGAAL